MEEQNNNKENYDPAYKYIKPTFKGKDPAYKFIKKESKNDDPAFKYINDTNNTFIDKFKRNFKSNLKKQDQEKLDKEKSPDNIDPAYKYIKQSDKAYEHIKKIKENNNQNIEAQKRLFGSIKNIGKAMNLKQDDWKSNLNDEEKEFLRKHPGPNFEVYRSFLIRFNKNRETSKKYPEKFTKQFLEPAQEELNNMGNWKNDLKEAEEKNFLFRNPGPEYEDLDAFKRRFNSYKLKKVNEQKKVKKTPLKTTKSVNTIESKDNIEAKPDIKKIEENNKTLLICFYCSSPMSEEDMFCGECGKPKKLTNKVLEKKVDTKVENPNSIQKSNLNELPLEALEYLKSLFDDELIAQNEYDILRKSILNLSIDSHNNNKINDNVQKIKLISREKLTELKNLFDNKLLDKSEYEILKKKNLDL